MVGLMQRELLEKAIRDALAEHDYETTDEWFDSLIAHGVRVVTIETIGAALDLHECVGDYSICNKTCAESVIDALDHPRRW